MDKKDYFKVLVALNIPVLLLLGLSFALTIMGKIVISLSTLIFLTLAILIGANVLYYFLLKTLNMGIQSVEMRLVKITQGDLNELGSTKKQKMMALSHLQELIDAVFSSLKSTLNFVESISKGNLDFDIKVKKGDLITEKLIELGKKLRDDKIELEKTKNSEEQRNWIATGLAQFSDVLRQDNQSLKQMSYKIVQNLIDYINLNQGALYVLNEDDTDNVYFEISAAVAYGREKLMNTTVKIGESLVGRCAFEKKTIYMTEIPDNYISITSGLGDSNPTNLLIVPCILDGKVFGIIEVAAFKNIESHQIGFIEKLGESIASTISNTRVRERTNALLAASQNQSEELAAQEEELRQNLEEMETTQEDLRRQMELNVEMRNELAHEKFLFDTLLEKIPARVFFKDKECRFVKASNSALKKFGMQNYSELAGLSDADLLKPEFAEKTMADERNIMKTREGRMNFIEHEITPEGKEIWKTVSKLPLINEHDECVGTFGIIQDITDFKLAEIDNERFRANYTRIMELINNNWYTLVLTEKGFIKRANKPFMQLFKADEKSIQNQFIDEFFKKYLNSGELIGTKIEALLNNEVLQEVREYKIDAKNVTLNEKYLTIDVDKLTKEILVIGIIS